MGKIRIKTIGDEDLEQQQANDAKKRSEAKKFEKKVEASEETSEEPSEATPEEKSDVKTEAEDASAEAKPEPKTEVKKEKKAKFKKAAQIRSVSYKKVAEKVDTTKQYSLTDGIKLLPELKRAKFDETIELHLTLIEGTVSVSTVLPHGTGKQTRVVIANGADAKAVDDLVSKIESGTVDFDVLVATPDAMSKLAKVARVLGPKGLMPNPKNGTVTPKPEEAAKKFEGGQVNIKSEPKFPLLHVAIGKVSFGDDKIKDNAKAVLKALDTKKIKNATLKSTMSPGIHLDVTSL